MAKDPTQGPVSTYDAEGNPIKTNVDPSPEEVMEETVEAEEVETLDEAPEEAEEEAEEEIWDRLTLVGGESDPDGGEVKHVEFTCDRCGETKQGMLLPEATVGFYATDEELGWSKYANEGEEILCDACMQSDERYLADYPNEEEVAPEDDIETYAKVPESEEAIEGEGAESEVEEVEDEALDAEEPLDIKDEITKERVSDEFGNPVDEDEYEEHSHDVKAPLSYGEAETLLNDTAFLKLREIALADGLKPERSKKKLIQQLLGIWYAPSEVAKTEDEQHEMSVRIRRIKGLM